MIFLFSSFFIFNIKKASFYVIVFILPYFSTRQILNPLLSSGVILLYDMSKFKPKYCTYLQIHTYVLHINLN